MLDEYHLTISEAITLYSFFLIFPFYDSSSPKYRSLKDYGWEKETITNKLKKDLISVFNYDEFIEFVPCSSFEKIVNERKLVVGNSHLHEQEKGIVERDKSKVHHFETITRHIRNCLAHSNYRLIMNNHTKMVLLEDRTTGQLPVVNARFILKLDTLLSWIRAIDKSSIVLNAFEIVKE